MGEEQEKITIRSLGSSLDNKDKRILWMKIEGDAFKDDPNYIPQIIVITRKKDVEVERGFFVLYRDEEPIGRATATLDKGWVERKKENIGFIDDFCIESKYKDLSGVLIKKCLSTLKEKKVEGVICRYQGFPGLAREVSEEPPFRLPTNPPWYIDIFLKNGFVKHKEWGNFRFVVPQKLPESRIMKGKELLKNLDAELKLIDMKKRDRIREYNKLVSDVFIEHFGYNPRDLLGEADSLIKHILTRIVCRLIKVRIYVLRTKSGEALGFFSFLPDMNIPLRSIAKSLVKGKINPFDIPKLLIILRRAKRSEVGGLGLTEKIRNMGVITTLFDHGVRFMRDDGYVEADTGPVLLENRPMVKIVEKVIFNRYGKISQQTYDVLLYTF